MIPVTPVLVALGAAVGAPSRYATDVLLSRRVASFPAGTLAVNVAGSLVLGVVAGLALHQGLSGRWVALLGTGFCGAFTTFSTFAVETVAVAGRRPAAAIGYLAASAVLGLAAAAAGLGLALA